LLAGSRTLTTTVMPLGNGGMADPEAARKSPRPDSAPRVRSLELVKSAAQATSVSSEEPGAAHPVDVMVRTPDTADEQAVESEAKKGYGLLMVGIKNTRTSSGEFHRDVARIVSAFDGPAAIVCARNGQLQNPNRAHRTFSSPSTEPRSPAEERNWRSRSREPAVVLSPRCISPTPEQQPSELGADSTPASKPARSSTKLLKWPSVTGSE
jgi:hypothetical protein